MQMLTIFSRIAITFLLSLIFGLERQRAHKPIGFGTYIFVSVGACALAITAISIDVENPLPLLSSIVTGIGFLGAGALIKTTDKIFGFTTAAGIWLFAIFGLTLGIGEYLISGVIYTLIWFVVFFDLYLETMGIGSYQKKLVLSTNQIINEKEIKDLFFKVGITKYKHIGTEVDKKNHKLSIVYLIEGKKENINKLPQEIFKKEWFDLLKIE